MELGWLAIYEPWLLTRLIWQPIKPGYIRLFPPSGAKKVIRPEIWGRGCPKSYICKKCKIVIFSYNEKNVT
jgi:hypothetical protein